MNGKIHRKIVKKRKQLIFDLRHSSHGFLFCFGLVLVFHSTLQMISCFNNQGENDKNQV